MLAQGKIPAHGIVTHVLSLDDIELAFALMQSGESLRVVLKP
jgi:Zn-dependent alcohol dehydrogenase